MTIIPVSLYKNPFEKGHNPDSKGILPQKVLHILNSAAGGAALSTIGLIEGLQKEGISSCAVCHDAGNEEEKEKLLEVTNGQTIFTYLYWWNKQIRASWWKRPLIEALQLRRTGWKRGAFEKVKDFAVSRKADLIHTNTILTQEGANVAKSLGLPHIWHLREMLGKGNPFRLPIEGKAFGDFIEKNCSTLIANSESSAEQIKDWVSPEILEIIPNGIDLSRFLSLKPRAKSDKIIIGMVGNLTSRVKKHSLFIEAAALVNKMLPLEFRIYGHDPTQNGTIRNDKYVWDLHERVRSYGLRGNFHFTGFVNDPVRIMSEIDILLHPADGESFGRIAVEAMAAGLPVIGVRGGGIGETVIHNETGLLAPPDDEIKLAEHIERLATDSALRNEFGSHGRKRAQDFYSLDTHISNIICVYKKAMRKPLHKLIK